MPKLSPVSWKYLVKRLSELGFSGPFHGSKHPFMLRAGFALRIPNPHHTKIGVPLLSDILRKAEISHEDWLGK